MLARNCFTLQGRRSRPFHWHAIGSFLHIDSSNLPLPLDTYLLNDLKSSFLSKTKPSSFALWKTMLEVPIYSFNTSPGSLDIKYNHPVCISIPRYPYQAYSLNDTNFKKRRNKKINMRRIPLSTIKLEHH